MYRRAGKLSRTVVDYPFRLKYVRLSILGAAVRSAGRASAVGVHEQRRRFVSVASIRRGVVLLGVATAAAISAAGVGAAPAARALDNNTFSFSSQGPIQSFNPWDAPQGANGSLTYNDAVYDTLLNQAPNGKLLPSLVTSWKVVNPLKITMTMRSGVKFDDGTPVDANTVKANFQYAQTTKTPGQCASYVQYVTVTVTSPTTFTLQLRTPNPDILPEIALCAGFMVNPKALANPTSLKTAPDGSGPYTYEPSQTVPNSKWVFVKRSNHWHSSLFPFEKLIVNFFGDATAADNAARSGQLDFIQSVNPTDTSSGLKLFFTEPNQLRGFAIADLKGEIIKPLGNRLVRQAMNYAVDRKAILNALYAGKGEISGCSCSWNSASKGWSKALQSIYTYDPAKAKQLLKQAGYAKGFDLPVMDSPLDPNAALLQAIAGYERKIGINMTVTPNSTTFIPTMLAGQTPAFFENWTITSFDYYNIAQTGGPHAFWNPRHVILRDITNDLKKILHSTGKAQIAAYNKAARDFAAEAVYISPVVLSNTAAYNSAKVTMAMTAGSPAAYLYNFQRP